MTGRATFGDFLRAAQHSLAPQIGLPSPARGDVDEVSRSLLRVVTLLARYTQDTTTSLRDVPHRSPAPATPWGRARAQALAALGHAAILLRPAGPRPAWPGPPSASPLARRLDEVAAALAAGRDLLHTHLAPGPAGGRAPASPWAVPLTSERVSRALLAEVGALAAPIAHHGANVALTRLPGAPTQAAQRQALNGACQWLWALAAAVQAANRKDPVPAADRDLLAAIPVNALPARPALTADTTVPGLCDGVIATAERLRHLAWRSARQPPWAPALTVTSLRQAAETSTLTSHHCALLAHTLTAAGPDLDAAAHAARLAATAWYHTARALRQVTTETRGHVTPAAAEARHLATWTGRLAHADPAWTLTTGPGSPPRAPQDLAPRPGDLPQVVAAVHHAADAVALLAGTEHHQVRGAARARRILVPTRTLDDDYDIPRPYAPAPSQCIRALLAAYRDTRQASHHATASIGRAASATRAPSRILTTALEATRTSPAAGPRDEAMHGGLDMVGERAGPLQHTLRGLGITSPALLARGADLDHASQRLLIDAADQLPLDHHPPPTATLNKTAASAALVNHALATGDPHAAQLLHQPGQTHGATPETQLELEA